MLLYSLAVLDGWIGGGYNGAYTPHCVKNRGVCDRWVPMSGARQPHNAFRRAQFAQVSKISTQDTQTHNATESRPQSALRPREEYKCDFAAEFTKGGICGRPHTTPGYTYAHHAHLTESLRHYPSNDTRARPMTAQRGKIGRRGSKNAVRASHKAKSGPSRP